jgi:hypothetical protein
MGSMKAKSARAICVMVFCFSTVGAHAERLVLSCKLDDYKYIETLHVDNDFSGIQQIIIDTDAQ